MTLPGSPVPLDLTDGTFQGLWEEFPQAGLLMPDIHSQGQRWKCIWEDLHVRRAGAVAAGLQAALQGHSGWSRSPGSSTAHSATSVSAALQGYKHTFDEVEAELDVLDELDSIPQNVIDDPAEETADSLCRWHVRSASSLEQSPSASALHRQQAAVEGNLPIAGSHSQSPFPKPSLLRFRSVAQQECLLMHAGGRQGQSCLTVCMHRLTSRLPASSSGKLLSWASAMRPCCAMSWPTQREELG